MKTLKVLSGMMATTFAAIAMSATMVASAAGNVNVTIGSATKAAGESFSVNVDLASVPSTGLSSIDFAIAYDSSVITITDVALGSIGNTGAAAQEGEYGDTLFGWNDNGDQIAVVWSTGLTDSNYWVKSNGTFLTISGTVNANAAAGATSPLTGVAVDRASAGTGSAANTDILFSAVGESSTEDYTAVFTNGSVTVDGGSSTDIIWGDADCNNQFELADCVWLAKCMGNVGGCTLSVEGVQNADLCTDTGITANDMKYMLQYYTGIIQKDALPIAG